MGRAEHGGEWPGVIHTLGAQSMLVPLGICMWAAWVWEATLILMAWCSDHLAHREFMV